MPLLNESSARVPEEMSGAAARAGLSARTPPAGARARRGTTRRELLLGLSASTVGAVVFTGCQPPKRELAAQSRVLMAEEILSASDNWYATTCRGCEAGCGTLVRVIEGRAKKVEGNPDHPVNQGKLCARGQAAVQEQYHPDRVQGPLLRTGARGSGAFVPISWDEALTRLVGSLSGLQGQGLGNQVAMLTRPLSAHQALVVDRFTSALGARWLRLDPLPPEPVLQTAVRQVVGLETLPHFDIEGAQYVLSFGADFLGTWLSPVHYGLAYGIFRQGSYAPGQQFQPRQGRPRGYLVQVEPRFSTTAASADEWVPVRPGREGLLALSLAQVIASENLGDAEALGALGGAGALTAYAPDAVAADTGVAAERIRQLARAFATSGPALALAGGPAAAQTNGTDSVAAVLALNLLVGNLGRAGGVLGNPPAPLEDLAPPAPISTVGDWQRLASQLQSGQVQLVLLHAANPVHGLPASLGFREALSAAPFIASFSSFMDDTTALADLVLPSHLPLEEWGDHVPSPGVGSPVLSLQQPVAQPLYDTRSVWDVLLTVGEELGGAVQQALPWPTFKDVIRAGARQLYQPQQPAASGPAAEADFERFWTRLLQRGGWWGPRERGAPPGSPAAGLPAWQPPRFAGSPEEYPFFLIPFPHQTLGAGENAHLPWLQAAPDPVTTVVWQTWVEVNPRTAARYRVVEGDLVALESPRGRVEVPVYVNPAAPPDVLGVPMGQGHAGSGRWAAGRGANPMDLLAPLADDRSGALAYAATRVRLVPVGRRVALPKFEGTVPARQLAGEEVLKVTGGT